jgi:hypothetical protein
MLSTLDIGGFSTEQSRSALQPKRRAAERRYSQAVTALAQRQAEFLAFDEAGAGASVLLDFLNEHVEKARKALAEAKAALINAAWADGTLTNEERLGEAVEGLLSAACT